MVKRRHATEVIRCPTSPHDHLPRNPADDLDRP
jgi:hypothetical protein